MTAIRLAGDDDAIDAAKADAAQALKPTDLFKSLAAFSAIGLIISLIGDWWWGLSFWVLPYLAWLQFVLCVRNITEHGATEVSENSLQNVRTTHANWIALALLRPTGSTTT